MSILHNVSQEFLTVQDGDMWTCNNHILFFENVEKA